MFPEFSKKYESSFRSILIAWIGIWTFVNIFTYIGQLISFDTYLKSSGLEVGEWFFKATGSFVGLLLGIILLFMLNAVKSYIDSAKQVTTNNIILVISCIYFIIPTLADLFGSAVFSPNQFVSRLPLTVVWLFPSITLLVMSIFYYINLAKYNEKFAKTTTPNIQ